MDDSFVFMEEDEFIESSEPVKVEKPQPKLKFGRVDADPNWRPNPRVLFGTLWEKMSGTTVDELKYYSDQLRRESEYILTALGIIKDGSVSSGDFPGTTYNAWVTNKLDWFHTLFMLLPAYHELMVSLEGDYLSKMTKLGPYLSLARTIGQVSRLHRDVRLLSGDTSISRDVLFKFLGKAMPSIGDTSSIFKLCIRLCPAMGVTPYRLYKLIKSFKDDYDFAWQLTTDRNNEPGYNESVLVLSSEGFIFDTISSGTLDLVNANYTGIVRVF